jgi:hypothetical protein
VRELEDEGVARLLHAVAEAIGNAADSWSRREAAALARELLAATVERLWDPAVPLPLLEAWLRTATATPAAPRPPPFAGVWARLVPAPPFDDPAEIAQADDWLALASILWLYRRTELYELGFPHRYAETLRALLEAGRRAPEDLLLSRALMRLARVAPDFPGLVPLLPELEDGEAPRRSDPVPDRPLDAFSVASVLGDL